jgi:hypothetical protein
MNIFIVTSDEYYHQLKNPKPKFVRALLLSILDNCPDIKVSPESKKVRNLTMGDVGVLVAEIDDFLVSTGHPGIIQLDADGLPEWHLPVELM